ncbi:RseA family anti-sigma factor [Pseudoxanthomonas sp. UTMC 1351]|uniref:RseA family anti-sigma factor n=1 Tax=Pseudoxanthomonas sp. UTMC 1351 TaxID=2695853 RepID=UPI0034CDF1FF
MTASFDLSSQNSEPDKFDTHYRLQLSSMMDGELSLDEARFLLRRLRHDEELNGCWERWQLCGDILRGQAQAPAPAGFAQRVALAIAAETQQSAANRDSASRRPRGSLARWGGGALAASVALVALFMARQQGPQDNSRTEPPAVAAQTPTDASRGIAVDGSKPDAKPESGIGADVMASAATGAVAVASVPRRQDSAARRSATRTQQAGRNATRATREPQRAVASAMPSSLPAIAAPSPALVPPVSNPFSKAPVASQPVASMSSPQARPWPRAVLQPYPSATGALTVGLPSDSAQQTFYPFEPRLPAIPPVAPPESAPQN